MSFGLQEHWRRRFTLDLKLVPMLSDQTLQFLKKDTYVEHFGDRIGGETFQVANAVLDSVEAHLKDLFLKDPGGTDVLRGHAREKFSVGCVFVKRLRANLNPLGRGKDYPKSPSLVPDQELKDKILPPDVFPHVKLELTQNQLINAESWISIHKQWGEQFTPAKMLSEEAGKKRFEWPVPDLAGVCHSCVVTGNHTFSIRLGALCCPPESINRI